MLSPSSDWSINRFNYWVWIYLHVKYFLGILSSTFNLGGLGKGKLYLLSCHTIWIEECGWHLSEIDGPHVSKVEKKKIIEVYVDDILIKSATVDNMLLDIRETFAILRRYDLKLNLEKCIFCVKSEHFLRYVITKRGIEANSAKVQAL